MKKRLLALTATAVAIATLGLAAPAHSAVPGYVRQGLYGWNDQCLGVGYYGLTNHTWTAYYCETLSPSGATGPGLYALWVAS